MPVDPALWEAACAHAGYSPDTMVLVSRPGAPLYGQAGVHLGPGDRPSEETAGMGLDFAAALDEPSIRGAHRIGVFEQPSEHIQLGLLRHELEHARQFDADDRHHVLYRLHPLIQRALSGLFRGPCSATMYQEIPHERDANVAATRLAVGRLGAPDEQLLASTHAPLVDTHPLEVDDAPLAHRALALAAVFPAEFEEVCGERMVGVRLLTDELGMAPDSWQALTRSGELAEFGGRARAVAPTIDELKAAEGADPRALWNRARRASGWHRARRRRPSRRVGTRSTA